MKDNFRLECLTVGMLQTNCYLLQNKDTSGMIIVDPGADADRIDMKINEMGGKPAAIFLTHSHMDHILAVRELKKRYPDCWLVVCEKEEPLYRISTEVIPGIPAEVAGEPDLWVKDGDVLNLIGTDLRVLHTPGHSCGSACYYFPELDIMFSGDTLFCQSCGRTDFPTGSGHDMMRSLERIASDIPDETEVFPGHMGFTTVADEKRFNPYMR